MCLGLLWESINTENAHLCIYYIECMFSTCYILPSMCIHLWSKNQRELHEGLKGREGEKSRRKIERKNAIKKRNGEKWREKKAKTRKRKRENWKPKRKWDEMWVTPFKSIVEVRLIHLNIYWEVADDGNKLDTLTQWTCVRAQYPSQQGLLCMKQHGLALLRRLANSWIVPATFYISSQER